MNPTIRSIAKYLGVAATKESKIKIVARLITEKQITEDEAEVLLAPQVIINIDKLEMSSGAKIVAGDDNEVNYR